MTCPPDQGREDWLDEAVQRFLEANIHGEEPDVEAFVGQYPGREELVRKKIESCRRVSSLLDSLGSLEPGEFQDRPDEVDLVGTSIEGFAVTEMLGRGGMGIVYKANDTKLGRTVAIKTMPAHLLGDTAARTRFRREARILATLNHPHIAVIHDLIEPSAGTCCLVLEYVAGRTLAECLEDGPMPVRQALSIAEQLAEALTTAHEQGIVHRDLKPSNIKIGPDGNIKVLDFGIAKMVRPPEDSATSVTTQQGRVLGTPAYMSPEQVRGLAIDQRADIWGFGCVLYELLTGKMVFEGATVSDTIARVLERTPDWTSLSDVVPYNIRMLLRRCLEKDPCSRLRHIGDAALEIRESLNPPAVVPPIHATVRNKGMKPGSRLAAALVSLALGTILGGSLMRLLLPQESRPGPTTSFTVPRRSAYPGLSLLFPGLALSPDGRTLAYVAEDTDGRRRLFIRPLDRFDSRSLDGTEGAVSPFFSPDGQWIGYDDHHNRKLKKVAVGGGVPVTLAEVPDFRGGAWMADGQIILAPDVRAGLYRISDTGGTLERITAPDPNEGEWAHLWPQALPDSRTVLFSVSGGSPRLEALQLSTGRRHVVLERGGSARYDGRGHLLYGRDWSLYAVRFDPKRFAVEGPHRMVASEVWQSGMRTSQFAVAANGVLAYVPGKWDTHKLQPVWVDRDGRQEPLTLPPRNYHEVRVSPDGTRIALCSFVGNNSDMLIFDAIHGTTANVAADQNGQHPVWVPGDPSALFYRTPQGLYSWKTEGQEPKSWGQILNLGKLTDSSPDGRQLLVQRSDPNDFAGWHDLWTIGFADGNCLEPVLFERTDHGQKNAMWSPCGRWVAYESDESGRIEIYVKPYPGPGPKVLVSPDGGREPLWSPDGKELYYRNRSGVVAAEIETDPQFRVVATETLFDGEFYSCVLCRTWDIAPDGRFLMLHDPETSGSEYVHIVLDWCDAL